MSLGKKLSNYRKLAGLTQQQLGETLNLSPQAISKWENDLAEPDLATLRSLSELYKVPIGELIGASSEETGSQTQSQTNASNSSADTAGVIGFCTECGITVTDETLAVRVPKILCKTCQENRELDARRAKELAEAEKKQKYAKNKYTHTRRLKISLIVSILIALACMAIGIASVISIQKPDLIPVAIGISFFIFTYVTCMFYECFVRDMFIDWTTKSFQFPGLIFTFDFDGIIWLIGMKLLFWVLGFILSAVSSLIGIVIGMICSPFLFPFIMANMHKCIKNGTESDYL